MHSLGQNLSLSLATHVACHRLARRWISQCTLGMPEAAQCCTAWGLSMQRALSSHLTPQVCMMPTSDHHLSSGILGINPRVPLSEPVSACGEATHVGMSWLPHQDCKQRMMCRSKLSERVGPTQALSQREDLRQGPRCHAWPEPGEGETIIADLLPPWPRASEWGLSGGSPPSHQAALCSLHIQQP